MADVDNVKLGICDVSFKGSNLGHTKGDVVVAYEPNLKDKTVNKYGTTPVGKYLIGQKLTAKVPLAESTIANKGIAIAESTGTYAKKIGGQVGADLMTEAGLLVLHPIANAAGDRSDDVVLYKAVSVATVEITYGVETDRVIEVTFEALLDESRSDGDQLGLIGDSAY